MNVDHIGPGRLSFSKRDLGPTEEMMEAILESIDITFGKQFEADDVNENKEEGEITC